jgi:hypothetical protein
MKQRITGISRRSRRRGEVYAQRAVGGFALLVMHELDALSGHVAEMRERLAVARKARGLGELVRDQVDLLPETRARLTLDQRERRALLHSWMADLRGGLRAAA